MIGVMAFSAIPGDPLNVKMRRKAMIAEIPLNAFEKYAAPLMQAEERLDYKAGQVIFYEGHKPYGIYVLRKGRIRLFRKKQGAEKLLRIIVPSHILGAEEVRETRPFKFGAKAETDVSISFFGASVFKKEAALAELEKNALGKGKKKKS